jgi:hypothetical protein
VQSTVARAIDLPHAAATEQFTDLISPEPRTAGQLHLRASGQSCRDIAGVIIAGRVVSSGLMRGHAGLRLQRLRHGAAVGLAFATVSCGERPIPPADPARSDTAAASAALRVGDPAPVFSLPGSDGRQYTLSDYRGRQAVVLVWFAKAFTDG